MQGILLFSFPFLHVSALSETSVLIQMFQFHEHVSFAVHTRTNCFAKMYATERVCRWFLTEHLGDRGMNDASDRQCSLSGETVQRPAIEKNGQ